MLKHFLDYYWKGGKPYGIKPIEAINASFSYKIIADPYYKRISIEKYCKGSFEKIIYDSILLDFRNLTQKDQLAWEREILKEEKDKLISLLRNQDGRAILIETITFKQNQCLSCLTSSVHGIPLSIHRMYYRSLQDSFDGVVLYDLEERPVMLKIYERDPQTSEFTNLLLEDWNMQTLPKLLQNRHSA